MEELFINCSGEIGVCRFRRDVERGAREILVGHCHFLFRLDSLHTHRLEVQAVYIRILAEHFRSF